MSEMSTAQRRKFLVDRIYTKGKISMEELSRQADVCVGTIYRDVHEIEKSIPVKVTTGRNGGVEFIGDRRRDCSEKLMASREEIELLEILYNIAGPQLSEKQRITYDKLKRRVEPDPENYMDKK